MLKHSATSSKCLRHLLTDILEPNCMNNAQLSNITCCLYTITALHEEVTEVEQWQEVQWSISMLLREMQVN